MTSALFVNESGIEYPTQHTSMINCGRTCIVWNHELDIALSFIYSYRLMYLQRFRAHCAMFSFLPGYFFSHFQADKWRWKFIDGYRCKSYQFGLTERTTNIHMNTIIVAALLWSNSIRSSFILLNLHGCGIFSWRCTMAEVQRLECNYTFYWTWIRKWKNQELDR